MPWTRIDTAIPYALIWDKGEFLVRVGGKLFNVSFGRIYQDAARQLPDVSIEFIGAELKHDRLGRVAHTRMSIVFPDLVEKQEEKEYWLQLIVNRVIEVYRFTTGEFYLAPIPKNEMSPYESTIIDGTGNIIPDSVWEATFPTRLTVARTSPIPLSAKLLLIGGTELPIARMLYLNARREELFENFRLAVVEAESAFEAQVGGMIARYYRSQGLAEEEIKNKLEAGLKNLLKDHLPKCCHSAFVGTSEHTCWEHDLYDLRNAVVHQGASVEAEQASKALDAAEKSLDWLEKRAST